MRLPEQRPFLVWCYANNEWPQLDDGKRTKPSTTHNQMLFRAVIVVETPKSSNQTRWEQLQRFWESEGGTTRQCPGSCSIWGLMRTAITA